MAVAVEAGPLSPRSVESVDSEYECELMIEALQRELKAVRSQLAFLTHNLDISLPCQQPVDDSITASHSSPVQTHRVNKKPVVKQERVEPAQMRDIKRYLEAVDQVEDERWKLRKRCLQLMQTHIEQQLHQLQERGELLKRRLRRREKKLKAERLKLKPPRYRSLGQDDTSFLAHLPQSTFYQIVGEEHRLRKTGKLTSLADIKEFWECMLSPIKLPTPPPQRSSRKPRPFLPEEDEDETSDSWAITALPRDHSPPTWKKQGSGIISPYLPTPSPNTDMFKFVPGKLPEIKPIAEIFSEGQTLLEEKQEAECLQRVQELTIERKRIRNVYQQARANEMAMRRLLPQLPTFDSSPIQDDEIMTSSTLYSSDEMEMESTRSSDTSHREDKMKVTGRISAESATRHMTPSLSSVSDDSRSSIDSPSPPPPRVCAPLTMESVVQHSPVIMEPKQKSALWSNYLCT